MELIRKTYPQMKTSFMSVIKVCLVILSIGSIGQTSFGQTTTAAKSHIISKSPRVANLKTTVAVNAGSTQQVSTSIEYFDWLGRPAQRVNYGQTPNGKDMVQFHVYNNKGQEVKNYLPYASSSVSGAFRTNATSEQSTFYNASNATYGTSSSPWAEVDLEDSPIQRTLEQGGVGSAYQLGGRTTKYEYGLNEGSDNVLLWELTASGGLKLSDDVFFAANMLDVVTVKDPQWVVADGNVGTSKTFTDYLGRTILSRSYNTGETYDTYYVYDDFGNVRYVIPPEAVRVTLSGNADQINDNQIFTSTQVFPSGNARNSAYYYMPGVTVTLDPTMEFLPGFSLEPYPVDDSFIEQWLYVSTYDTKNQLVTKKIPGADEVHYVYDKSGRLILSQDGNQRLTNQWTFTKYDRFDRLVLTGSTTDSRTQSALASHVATEITATGNKWYEEAGTAVHGYTNRVFPYVSNENDYLAASYYDDYDFKSSWSSTYDHVTNAVNSDMPETSPLGQGTGGKIKVLGTTQWLKSVKYYDEDGQLTQSVGDHHMGNVDRVYVAYNFVGDVTESRMEHVIDENKTVSITDRFEYDHAGRVTEQWHSIDDEPEVLIASNIYNELGESIETNLHSVDNGSNYIQSIDSRTDIQGRLTHINNAQRTNDGTYNDDGNDQFGMELYYDASPSGFGFTPKYNGALAGATWSNATMGSVDQRGYAYSYDRSSRLTGASYKEKDNNLWTTKVGHYDVNISDYDYNGNIERLTRKATIGGTVTTIDDLTYSYDGNQLQAVNDATTQTEGFKDGAELSTEYTYDTNGNMLTDSNKLITSITYNQLNKPEVITFSSGDKITYTYDASGARLKQEITVSGSVSQTYDYVAGMLFDDGELAEVSHRLGRLKVDVVGNDYTYDYQYFLSDHLGNTRAMIAPLERKYVAGMETNRADQEEAQFLYVSETRISGQAKTGSKSSMLNAAASPAKVLGPAKGFKVYNGDQINMEVWAKHASTSGVNETGTNNVLLTALSAAFGVNSASSGEGLQIYNGLNAAVGANTLIDQSPGNTPTAYLNYLFFDNNYVYQSGGFAQVNSTVYTKLTNSFTANQDGYLFVYLSNESTLNANVYFDDLVITHTSNDAVLQADDYYPFGLPMNNNFLEVGVSKNRFLYQGKEWQAELGLNLYDFHARQFDPTLGRWLAQDPQNQFASPYLGMGNLPHMGTDPDGELFGIDDLIAGVIGGVVNVVSQGIKGNLKGGFFKAVGKGFAAFGAGAAAGALATYGPAGWVAGGAILGATNSALSGGSLNQIGRGALFGGVTGLVGGGIGRAIAPGLQGVLGNIKSPAFRGLLGGTLGGGITGGALGGASSALSGGSFWDGAGQGALNGAITGGIAGGASAAAAARANGFNPWTGQARTRAVTNTPKLNLELDDIELPSRTFPRKPVAQIEGSSRVTKSSSDPLGANGTSLRSGDFAKKSVVRGKVPHIRSGQLTEANAMTMAQKFLGPGYKEVSSGRFVSSDGMRQIRFGYHEVKGALHIHFEAYAQSVWNGGVVIESTATRIVK